MSDGSSAMSVVPCVVCVVCGEPAPEHLGVCPGPLDGSLSDCEERLRVRGALAKLREEYDEMVAADE